MLHICHVILMRWDFKDSWLVIFQVILQAIFNFSDLTYMSLKITSLIAPYSGVSVATILVLLMRAGNPPKKSPPFESGALIAILLRNLPDVWYASSILSSTSFLFLMTVIEWYLPSLKVLFDWRTSSVWPEFKRTCTCPLRMHTE